MSRLEPPKHQNMVNFSLDREVIGSRLLGSREHRHLAKDRIVTSSAREILNSPHVTSRLPRVLAEREFDLVASRINKIFCGQWLDERRCLLGTKCNKLVLLDTLTGMYAVQTPLKSHPASRNIPDHCGIHAIAVNPSRTFLATGAENVNDVAVYSLPDLEPVMTGYRAHSYWIFDIIWLDDEHIVSGAGDNKLALWSLGQDEHVEPNTWDSSFICRSSHHQTPRKRSLTSTYSPLSPSRIPIAYNRTSITSQPSSQTIISGFLSLAGVVGASRSSFSLNTSPTVSQSPFRSLFSSYFRSSDLAQSRESNNNNSNASLSPNRPDSPFVGTNGEEFEAFTDDDDDEDETSFGITEDENEVESDNEEDLSEYEHALRTDSQLLRNTTARKLANHERMDLASYSSLDQNDSNDNIDFEEDDNDDDQDEHTRSFQKRRRLDWLGSDQGTRDKPCRKSIRTETCKFRTPSKIIKCKQSKRIRALAFNPKRNEIAAISMNSAFHYFDVKRFEQKYTKKLSPLKENVCLTINEDYSIYAVGSASHVQLLDANNARPLTEPVLVKQDIGIRSLHFRNHILSVGTGVGTILFYDVRANKFLNANSDSPLISPNESALNQNLLKLETNGGWIWKNESYYEQLPYSTSADNTHAIYSHSYDPSGTKLLSVGGPLTITLFGHYAAVWK